MVDDPAYDPWALVAQLDWPFRRRTGAAVVAERIRGLADRLGLVPERVAAWGVAQDVEGGLWAASEGRSRIGREVDPIGHPDRADAGMTAVAQAFRTLPAHIAARALALLDQALAGQVQRPVLVAAVIPHPERRAQVLMTGRRYAEERVWSWPSGHVEAGERPVDAVIREVEEELVIADPRVVRHLGDVDTRADVSRWWGRRFRHGYVMHHFQLSVAAPNVAVIDHEALLVAEWRTLDQVVEAVATLPPELAEAAVKFARMAAAGPAVASAISTPAQAEKLLSPTGGVWEPIREYMEGDPSGTSARRARKGAET